VSGQGVSVGGGGCTAPLSRSLRLVPDGFRPPPRSDRSRCPKPSATVATQSQRTPAARRAGAVEAGDRADHVMRHVTLPRCDRSPRPQSTCHASPGLRLRSHVTMPPSITAGMPGRDLARLVRAKFRLTDPGTPLPVLTHEAADSQRTGPIRTLAMNRCGWPLANGRRMAHARQSLASRREIVRLDAIRFNS